MVIDRIDEKVYRHMVAVYHALKPRRSRVATEELVEAVWNELETKKAWVIHDMHWQGFVMLMADQDAMLLNPYIFEGIPAVRGASHPMSQNLMKAALDFFRQSDQARLSSVVYTEFGSDAKQHVLEEGGMSFDYEYVEMRCLLERHESATEFPEGYTIHHVDEHSEEVLKTCFDEAFAQSDVKYYQNLTASERQGFYNDVRLFGVLEHPLSIAVHHGRELVGYAFVCDYQGIPYITSMCVKAPYRGLGVGGGILHWIKEQAYLQGFKAIGLGTEMEMRAYGLYRRAGFENIRHRKYFVYFKD